MDVVADFTTDVWVVAVEVATVGVDSIGRIGFTGEDGVAGIGWAITFIFSFSSLILWLSFSSPLSWALRNFLGQGISNMGRSAGA